MRSELKLFTPLMHEFEYKFIEKYLDHNDTLLEWGSGNGTIYFSALVNKLISIEHDKDYYRIIKNTIDAYDIKNIDLFYVPGIKVKDQKKDRHVAFADYIKFPVVNDIKFNKVLIDGRARKHCAIFISEYIDENTLVFIHDFNYNNVEGYVDETYFDDILKYYDIFDVVESGQGIVALKKKK